MPVDNALYDQPGDLWWDDTQPLAVLRTLLNPVRLTYLRSALASIGLDAHGLATLDVGCGGGLLTEALAQLGCAVTGVDPSAPSLATAREHAAQSGLAITYVTAPAEHLPFADASFALVTCCDVLEHLAVPDLALGEIARVLAPGGLFLYDTLNRTLPSWLVMIGLAQWLPATRVVPPGLHDWRCFIRPAELHRSITCHGLTLLGETGLLPRTTPLAALRAIRQCRRGTITYAELGRHIALRPSALRSISYIGYAVKANESSTREGRR
jgi:2-polyprenyl-6-hydroxyphenyl methylase/3-demethylubiquinone-9 3-methyltransferase